MGYEIIPREDSADRYNSIQNKIAITLLLPAFFIFDDQFSSEYLQKFQN